MTSPWYKPWNTSI